MMAKDKLTRLLIRWSQVRILYVLPPGSKTYFQVRFLPRASLGGLLFLVLSLPAVIGV